ncbi:trypsin-like serine protease [Methylobacterium sp. 77]|uniref:S1 family peptidase n=1 Tax=Methylobacterium sp. 77 TaxID=1101192 RepID=UPI00037FA960|nr:trypsin-like serine protease [Methylobacterium sp. 77]
MGLDTRSIGIALMLVLAGAPADAVVGGREAPESAGSAVMVLSSLGGVCTGIVIAQDAVLTAGHCVAAGSRKGGAEHRVHFRDEAGQPVLVDLAARAVHPGYDAGAIAGRRRSIDLALVRTATPLPGRFRPTALSEAMPRAGEILVLAGYGVSKPGEARTTGTFRNAVLPVVEPYGQSRILVWMKPSGAASGACQGDSGGPIAAEAGAAPLAVSAWVGGGACGGVSQGVLLGPQRDWIDRTLAGWGASARWQTP